jgi:hypothetical protein
VNAILQGTGVIREKKVTEHENRAQKMTKTVPDTFFFQGNAEAVSWND